MSLLFREKLILECKCESFDHLIRFDLDEEGELWLDVALNRYRPWYERVWLAVNYIFGYDSHGGHYDVTLLDPKDYDKIRKLLNDSEKLISAPRVKQEKLAQERGV